MHHPIYHLDRPLYPAIFLKRVNRFLGLVVFEERQESAHVHDPGRLKELLYPGNKVLVARPTSLKGRKTSLDLMFAQNAKDWIPVNSSLQRPISQRFLLDTKVSPFKDIVELRPEAVYRPGTRFDYFLRLKSGREYFLEVKGCTLEDENHIALFPDAPTTRGSRHLSELKQAKAVGFGAGILFLIFRPRARYFAPNVQCDPDFSSKFYECLDAGVEVYFKRIAFKRDFFVYTGDITLLGGHSP